MKKTFRSTKQRSVKKRARFVPAVKKSLVTLTHWLAALALLPLVWAAIKTVISMTPALGREGTQLWWAYAAGIVGYLLVDRFIARPMTLYVFGHELTHAISGLLSGARIRAFRASAKGGEVTLSKTNLFISLSPYIVPLYAIFLMILYSVIRLWWPSRELMWAFQVLFGAALCFHWAMTLRAIHTHQPDLKSKGLFLSVVLILLGNILIIGSLMVMLFGKTPTMKQYTYSLWKNTVVAGRQVWAVSKQATSSLWTR